MGAHLSFEGCAATSDAARHSHRRGWRGHRDLPPRSGAVVALPAGDAAATRNGAQRIGATRDRGVTAPATQCHSYVRHLSPTKGHSGG